MLQLVRLISAITLLFFYSAAAFSQFNFSIYNGNFTQLPDFTALTPIDSGTSDVIAPTVTGLLNTDNFGLVFTNQITVTDAANYEFQTNSDAGSRLYINGTLVVDNDGIHEVTEVTGQIFLNPGSHSLRVEYFETTGNEVLEVTYRIEGGVFRPIRATGELDSTIQTVDQAGEWGPVIAWPHIAISAANLPDGRILTWSSTETNEFPANREYTHSAIFDPSNNTFQNTDNNFHDMFCAGVSTLENGVIIASGGNPTDRRTSMFDPSSSTWAPLADMFDLRWYATNATLPNNEIFATFGLGAGNRSEKYDSDTNAWTRTPNANMQTLLNEHNFISLGGGYMEWFPHIAVQPNGRVFHGGPTPTLHTFDPIGGTANEVLGQPTGDRARMWGNAVAYDVGKVILLGGSDTREDNRALNSNVFLVDLNGPTPVITNGPPMHYPRVFNNAVTLPNGEILLIGGNTSGQNFSDDNSILPTEIYNPDTNSWRIADSIDIPRNYHSTAILLQDATVLSAGGGACGDACNTNHLDGQIYNPPYLYNPDGSSATRPTLTNVPPQSGAGREITVTASSDTQEFSMIRLSATTHHLNTDQRFIPVPSVNNGDGTYTLTMHANQNVLIAGNYWLYAVNANGTPSLGENLQILRSLNANNGNSAPPNNAIQCAVEGEVCTLPINSIATVWYGADGSFNSFQGINGSIGCNDGLFGNPIVGVTKACLYVVTDTLDTDGDGVIDSEDAFPNDPTETQDSDGDGIGDNADPTPNGDTGNELLEQTANTANLTGDFELSADNQFIQIPDGAGNEYDFSEGISSADFTFNVTTPGSYQIEGSILTSGANADESDSFYVRVDGAPATPYLWDTGTHNTFTPVRVTNRNTAGNVEVDLAVGTHTVTIYLREDGTQLRDLKLVLIQATGPVDTDGDGVFDNEDAFPNDPTETVDTDGDGVGNNADAFPTDPTETVDTDADGVGDNTDVFPTDPTETLDTDGDGIGDNADSTPTTGSNITALPALPRNSTTLIVEASSGADRIWNVNPDNNTVSISSAAGALLQEISVGLNPWSLAKQPNTDRVFVTNKKDNSISIINTQTLAVEQTIPLPFASQPHGIVFNSTGSTYYVVLEATLSMEARNATDHAVIGSTLLSGTPRHITMTYDDSRLLISNFITPPIPGESTANVDVQNARAEVFVVDPISMGLTNTIVLSHDNRAANETQGPGIPNYLNAPVISFDNQFGYVPSKKDNIDSGMLRGKIGMTFDTTVRANTSRIALSTENQDANNLAIDFDNSSVATGAALTGDSRYLIVALETSNQLAVFDTINNFQVMRLPTGRAPQGVALSTDSSIAYVHNFMDRSISRFDLTRMIETELPSINVLSAIDVVGTETLSNQILLGKQLFYDAADDRLARDDYMSCASCHNEGDSDGRVWDISVFGEGLRNTITLQGHGSGHGRLHWTSNFDEVQDFEGQIRSLSGGTGLMTDTDFAAGTRSEPLGDPKAGVSTDLDALAAYVNSLTTIPANPYALSAANMTDDAKAGEILFVANDCTSCHTGTVLTDSDQNILHDIGTIDTASGQRLGSTLNGFDTPTLLGIFKTAPYLHDGAALTVAEAISAHDSVNLNATELNQLAAYLEQASFVDTDGDGILDTEDAFPNDPNETTDTDGDGVGDNSDVFPNDPAENADTDGDGVGNNADAFPNDATETSDTDGDGVGDNTDVFPNDPTESVDSDGDGIGDNSDPTPNGDNVETLELSADAAVLTGDFELSTNNQFIQVADGTGNEYDFAEGISSAEFTFNVATAGSYQVEGTILTSGANVDESDSFYVRVNSAPANPYLWDTGEQNTFTPVILTNRNVAGPVQIDLLAGPQIVTFYLREDGAQLSSLRLVLIEPAENVAPSVNLTAPTANAEFTIGDVVSLTANATDIGGTVTSVEFYDGTTLLTTDSAAPYSFSWNSATEGTHTLTAVATDNDGASTTSSAIAINVIPPPPNVAPTVSLTAPTNNVTFTVGAVIALTANAADSDGTVTSVEFYDGAALLGTDTTAPYSFSWNGATVGAHTLTAVATDNDAAITTSVSVAINIEEDIGNVNIAPTVSLTAPTANTIFITGDVITLSANAIDSDGTVTSVEFYDGATLIGTDTTTPYNFSWNGAIEGVHSLTAIATDDDNDTSTSTTITVTVVPPAPNVAPTVILTGPVATTFTVGDIITLTANAADSDGNVTSVEFYDGSSLLSTDTTAPYSFTWSGASEGAHTLTAVAIDNDSASTTSASAAINVEAATGGGEILELSADAAILDGFFVLSANNQFIEAPEGSGNEYDFNEGLSSAEFTFNVVTAGNYLIEGSILTSGVNVDESDSFYVRVDGAPGTPYLWDTGEHNTFEPVIVTNRNTAGPVEVNLTAGTHTVTLYLREDGTQLSSLRLVPVQ
ncbi:MAG: Ig-like domain-containing protein [Gammaproteobacteria bacterium]